jgi:membrane fusion protein, multidrug efflux system
LSSSRNQAGYASLLADVSGVVTGVEAEVGQVVGAGTPVVRIAQDGPRDVVFSVPEDRVGLIKSGSSVSVRTWAAGSNRTGTVREVAATADPVTRTYLVKVSMESKDNRDALPLGSTVYVSPQAFSMAGTPVIKLPTSALKQDGKTTAVWVLDPASMTLKLQPIEIATADGNDAVISAGLVPGMMVVSAGVHVLQAGQKVTLYKEKGAVAPENKGATATNSVANGASSMASGKAPAAAASAAAK